MKLFKVFSESFHNYFLARFLRIIAILFSLIHYLSYCLIPLINYSILFFFALKLEYPIHISGLESGDVFLDELMIIKIFKILNLISSLLQPRISLNYLQVMANRHSSFNALLVVSFYLLTSFFVIVHPIS